MEFKIMEFEFAWPNCTCTVLVSMYLSKANYLQYMYDMLLKSDKCLTWNFF